MMGRARAPSRPVSRVRAALALVLGSAAVAPVHALTDSNYIGMQVGERPMGMGGAYRAVSDDPSGLYYNPAGIVYAHSPNLSASVNAYHSSTTRYAQALGESDWVRDSQELLPNFFGTVQPLGPLTVGFSYAVPQAVREEQAQTFTSVGGNIDYFSVNVDNSDTINQMGPSVALEVNERLSLGGTVYMHQREQKTILTQVARLGGPQEEPDNAHEVLNTYTTREEMGLKWIMGAVLSVTERVALGLTVSGTSILNATNSSQALCHGSSEGDETLYEGNDLCHRGKVVFQDRVENGARHSYPMEFGAGLAWFASPRLLLSGDMTYYTAVDGRLAVVNYAAGGEYYLGPDWAIRAGGYTNHANTPDVETSTFTHQVDRYGMAASVTRFSRNSSVTVGFNSGFGSGSARIIDSEQAGTQDVTTNSLTLFLATSYAY